MCQKLGKLVSSTQSYSNNKKLILLAHPEFASDHAFRDSVCWLAYFIMSLLVPEHLLNPFSACCCILQAQKGKARQIVMYMYAGQAAERRGHACLLFSWQNISDKAKKPTTEGGVSCVECALNTAST